MKRLCHDGFVHVYMLSNPILEEDLDQATLQSTVQVLAPPLSPLSHPKPQRTCLFA
jgi:hypothetical protein